MSSFQTSTQDYGLEPVPADQQMGWLKIAFILFGINICLPAFVLGSVVAQQATWTQALLAVFFASVILTLIGVGMGLVGNQTRLSLAISTQNSFGRQGRHLLSVLLFLTSLGWFAIQLEIFGQVLGSVLKILFAGTLSVPDWIFLALGGVAMTATALFGLKSIARFSLLAVPILLLILLSPLFLPGFDLSFSMVLNHVPQKITSLGTLVSSVTGAVAVGVILMPDITRYSKSAKDTFWGVSLGMMTGLPFVLILCAYFAMASTHGDLLALWLSNPQTWWLAIVLLAVILSTWTTNDNNIYSAALALNSVVPQLPKWQLTLVCGALGTALATIGLLQHFGQWLMLLALTVPPIGAVLILDCVLVKSKHFQILSEQDLPQFRSMAWLAWLLGMALGILSQFQWITLSGIPALDALLATASTYLLFQRHHS